MKLNIGTLTGTNKNLRHVMFFHGIIWHNQLVLSYPVPYSPQEKPLRLITIRTDSAFIKDTIKFNLLVAKASAEQTCGILTPYGVFGIVLPMAKKKR